MAESLDSSKQQELITLEKEGKKLAAEGNLKESLEKFELAKNIYPSEKILRRIETLKRPRKADLFPAFTFRLAPPLLGSTRPTDRHTDRQSPIYIQRLTKISERNAAGKSKKKKTSKNSVKMTAEKKQSEELQLRVSELQKKVDDLQQEIIKKDKIIKDLKKTIEELKVPDSVIFWAEAAGSPKKDVLIEESNKTGKKRKAEDKENGTDCSIIEEVQNVNEDGVNAEIPTKKKKTEKSKAKTKKDVLTDETKKSNKVPKLKSTPASEDDQDQNLPEGWIRKDVVRKSGKTAGTIDTYFYSPDGKKFRSRSEIAAYLAATKSDLKIEYFNFSSKKKSTKSTNKDKSTRAVKPRDTSPSY